MARTKSRDQQQADSSAEVKLTPVPSQKSVGGSPYWVRRVARGVLSLLALLCLVGILQFLLDGGKVVVSHALHASEPSIGHSDHWTEWLSVGNVPYEESKPTINETEKQDHWASLGGKQRIERRGLHISASPGALEIELTLALPRSHPLAEEIAWRLNKSSQEAFAEGLFGNFGIPNESVWALLQANGTWVIDSEKQLFLLSYKGTIHWPSPQLTLSIVPTTQGLSIGQDELSIHLDGVQLVSLSPLADEAKPSLIIFRPPENKFVKSVVCTLSNPSYPEEKLVSTGPERKTVQQIFLQTDKLFSQGAMAPLRDAILGALPLLLLAVLIQRHDNAAQSVIGSETQKALRKVLFFHFALYSVHLLAQVLASLELLKGIRLRWRDGFFFELSNILYDGNSVVGVVVVGLIVPVLLIRDMPEASALLRGQVVDSALRWMRRFVVGVFSGGLLVALYFTLTDQRFIKILVTWSGLWIAIGATVLLCWGLLRLFYRTLADHPPAEDFVLLCMLVLVVSVGVMFMEKSFGRATFSSRLYWPVIGTLMNGTVFVCLGASLWLSWKRIRSAIVHQAGTKGHAEEFKEIFSFKMPLSMVRWLWVAVGAWGLVLVLPVSLEDVLTGTDRIFSYVWSVQNFAARLDRGILELGWFFGVIGWLWWQGREQTRIDVFTRNLGILAAASMLFPMHVMGIIFPVAFLLGGASLWMLIQPANHWKSLEPLYSRVVKDRISLLDALLMVSATEKASKDFRKTLHTKLASGEIQAEEYKKQIAESLQSIGGLARSTDVEGHSVREVALAFGPHGSAWSNGVHGALFSSIFAAPWSVLFLRDYLGGVRYAGSYEGWDLCFNLLLFLIRWASFGFIFGYFFPYIQGRSGLVKGLWFILAIIIPQFPRMLLENSTSEAWKGDFFWILQIFIQCMLLGLIAFDYQVLRKGRHHWRMLFEIHGLPSVGVSVSSIVLAMGTTVMTLLNGEAKNLVALLFKLFVPIVSPDLMSGK